MKEMHQRGGGLGLHVLWSVDIARVTLIPKPAYLHVHTASSCNVNVECCGTYSSSNKKCQGSSFRNSAGEAYRSQYTYFSNLVARMRLPVLRRMSG